MCERDELQADAQVALGLRNSAKTPEVADKMHEWLMATRRRLHELNHPRDPIPTIGEILPDVIERICNCQARNDTP